VIDVLDFPLDPPDAEDARGGGDFGRYRSRYGLYHAGEDWGGPRGRSSLGAPVYSIGHGVVTYAEPLGWGADVGIVIVRHAFADGSTVLSFYGHLDPSSVVLHPGECVARGDRVGRIGKPRGSPHLHFEMRTHMPAEPGRGYAPKDPTLSGWLSPSQFIWQYRLAVSPGVQWVRPPVDGRTRGIGLLDEDTFLAIRDQRLIGIGVADGNERWRQLHSINAYDALIHPDRSTIYATSLFGTVEAFRLSGTGGSAETGAPEMPLESLWVTELEVGGFPVLMPLPGGGVVVSTRQGMAAISSTGEVLWQREAATVALDWILLDDELIVTTPGSGDTLWSVGRSGAIAWEISVGGRLAVTGGGLLAYDTGAIWRLNPSERSAELWHALPGGYPGYDEILATSSGGVLVTHRAVSGGSLLALDADGALRWRRSYPRELWGQKQLLVLDGRAYVVSQSSLTAGSAVSVYEVDLERGALHRIFAGGSRQSGRPDTWTSAFGVDRLLVNIGGTGMVALDPRAASEAVRAR
jgi:hypothetical protein